MAFKGACVLKPVMTGREGIDARSKALKRMAVVSVAVGIGFAGAISFLPVKYAVLIISFMIMVAVAGILLVERK
jgi:hypothetical protein